MSAAFVTSAGLVALGVATGRDASSSVGAGLESRAEPRAGDGDRPNTMPDAAPAPAPPLEGRAEPAAEPEQRVYDGRPIRAVRTMRMRVTAYSPDERSCGVHADGITASGYSVETNGGALVAADPRVLPLGSLVSVPGYDDGAVVPVLDVGGAIKGARLDVLFATHGRAIAWGVRELDVTVWEFADGRPSGFRRQRRPSR